MINQQAFILDPVNPQYPFAQWNGKSEHEGKLLCRAEERDTSAQQVNKNTRLAAHHVDLHIENATMQWQPQYLTQNSQNKVDATMVEPDTTKLDSVDQGKASAAEGPVADGLEEKTLLDEAVGEFVLTQPKFSETEIALLQKWVPRRSERQTLFSLLFEIAMLQLNWGSKRTATTERLMTRSTLDPLESKTDVFRSLKGAGERGLVCRHGELNKSSGAGSTWTLTAEGKRFVIVGVRARLKMKEISALDERQICQLIAVDEISDWDAEMHDRSRKLSTTAGAGETHSGRAGQGKDTRSRKGASRTPSNLTHQTEPAAKAVSREEVAQDIERQALEKAKADIDPSIGPMWSSLLR